MRFWARSQKRLCSSHRVHRAAAHGSAIQGLVPETWPPQAVFLAAAVPGSLAPRFGHEASSASLIAYIASLIASLCASLQAARRGVRRGDELCGVNGRLVRSFEVAEDRAESRASRGAKAESQRLLSLRLFQDLARELRKRP